MKKMFLCHPDRADLVWEILSYDKTTKKAKLKGHFATIEVDFDMAQMKEKGYKLTKGADDAEQPGVQA